MILRVKEFYSNNLDYEINPQSTGIATGDDGRDYYFSYCRTVFANCFIKEISSDKLIHGNFHFYQDGLIEFNLGWKNE